MSDDSQQNYPPPPPPKRVEEHLLREQMIQDWQKLGMSLEDAQALAAQNPISWERIEDMYLEAHPEHPANYHQPGLN